MVYSVYPGFPGAILVQSGEDMDTLLWAEFPSGARYAWMPPLVADPERKKAFFFLADHLYRYDSEDGESWQAVVWSDKDFAKSPGEYLTGMAFSPLDPQRAYAATSYGRMFVSDDGGVSWETGSGDGPEGHYFYGTTVVASRVDRDTAWVGGSGYSGPAVYRTTDGGQSWASWGEGIPATLVYALAEAPDGSGRVFAGTESAAYERAPGQEWLDITGDAAPVTIYWSAEPLPHENTFRFGTYGRGIWDYQLDPEHVGCFPVQDWDADGVECDLDCDDHEPAVFPGAEDVCGDGVDADCDGVDACETPAAAACGCATGGGALGWLPLLAVAAGIRRQRVR